MKHLLAFVILAGLLAACRGSEDSGPAATASPSASPPPHTPTAAVSPEPSATRTSTPTLAVSATAAPSPEPTLTPSPTSTSTAATASGVEGVALVGPTCPVVQAGTPCPDRPWQGVVVAQDLTGREVARTTTDAEGRFAFVLPPGEYILVTLTEGLLPAPAELPVTVVAGKVAYAELLLDSGIR